jgi:uncharacterized Zn-finger protein
MEFQMERDAPETEEVTRTHVACDGGGGAGGHPRVWLQIDPRIGFVECGYCDKKFVLRAGSAERH